MVSAVKNELSWGIQTCNCVTNIYPDRAEASIRLVNFHSRYPTACRRYVDHRLRRSRRRVKDMTRDQILPPLLIATRCQVIPTAETVLQLLKSVLLSFIVIMNHVHARISSGGSGMLSSINVQSLNNSTSTGVSGSKYSVVTASGMSKLNWSQLSKLDATVPDTGRGSDTAFTRGPFARPRGRFGTDCTSASDKRRLRTRGGMMSSTNGRGD